MLTLYSVEVNGRVTFRNGGTLKFFNFQTFSHKNLAFSDFLCMIVLLWRGIFKGWFLKIPLPEKLHKVSYTKVDFSNSHFQRNWSRSHTQIVISQKLERILPKMLQMPLVRCCYGSAKSYDKTQVGFIYNYNKLAFFE